MNKFRLAYILSLLAWLAFIAWLLIVPVQSIEEEYVAPSGFSGATLSDVMLEAIVLSSDVDKPAQEPKVFTKEENFRAYGNKIEDCLITHYCCEKYEHICGTGDGLTSTGKPVTPYLSCAVDSSVIPYGATVMVDYGDSVSFFEAQDCGAWIKGNHIDLAVETHAEAMDLGMFLTNVYWMEAENGID